jgi:hypothetical protein
MEISFLPHAVLAIRGANKWRLTHFLIQWLLLVAQTNGDQFSSSYGAYCQLHKQMEILPHAMLTISGANKWRLTHFLRLCLL